MSPSKISPTSSPFLLMTGEPELPPTTSLVVQKFIFWSRLSRDFALHPAIGQLEGRCAGRAAIGAGNGREGLDVAAGLVIAFYRAVRETEREGGVRIDREAIELESGLGDQPRILVEHGLDVLLIILAHRPCVRVQPTGRIGSSGPWRRRSRPGRPPAVFLRIAGSLSVVLSIRSVSQLFRRPVAEDLLHRRIVGAEQALHHRQREAERRLLQVGIDRRCSD